MGPRAPVDRRDRLLPRPAVAALDCPSDVRERAVGSTVTAQLGKERMPAATHHDIGGSAVPQVPIWTDGVPAGRFQTWLSGLRDATAALAGTNARNGAALQAAASAADDALRPSIQAADTLQVNVAMCARDARGSRQQSLFDDVTGVSDLWWPALDAILNLERGITSGERARDAAVDSIDRFGAAFARFLTEEAHLAVSYEPVGVGEATL